MCFCGAGPFDIQLTEFVSNCYTDKYVFFSPARTCAHQESGPTFLLLLPKTCTQNNTMGELFEALKRKMSQKAENSKFKPLHFYLIVM